MRNSIYFIFLRGLAFTLLFLGCETNKTIGMTDLDQNSKAAGAAYVVDAMTTRRPMTARPLNTELDFYFQRCQGVDAKTYYSKTSFECTDPF